MLNDACLRGSAFGEKKHDFDIQNALKHRVFVVGGKEANWRPMCKHLVVI